MNPTKLPETGKNHPLAQNPSRINLPIEQVESKQVQDEKVKQRSSAEETPEYMPFTPFSKDFVLALEKADLEKERRQEARAKGQAVDLYCPFVSSDPAERAATEQAVEAEKLKCSQAHEEKASPAGIVSATPMAGQPYKAPAHAFTPSPFLDGAIDTPLQATLEILPSAPSPQPSPSLLFAKSNTPTALPSNRSVVVANPSPSPTPERIGGDLSVSRQPAVSEYDMLEKAAHMVSFAVYRGAVYCFNGTYYERLSSEDAVGVILDLCRDDVAQNGKFTPLKNAGKFLETDRRFHVKSEWVEQGLRFVTFQNGNLNLDNGQLCPHTPSIFTTYALQANYLGMQYQVETPVFDRFLYRISGGDPNIIERILQMLGYVLTSDTQAKCCFLLQGVTNSGKSVLCNFIRSFFPEEKCTGITLDSMGDRFAAAELDNAALCTTPDLPSKPLPEKAVAMLKALTGNDLIQADRKYRSYTKFRFRGKLIMCSNHPLLTKVRDTAFEDRIVVIPFLHRVPRSEWNDRLLDDLAPEKDGVASNAISAYYRLRNKNYIFAGDYALNSDAVIYQSVDRRYLSPELAFQFLRAYYVADPDSYVFVADAYEEFCQLYQLEPTLAVFGKCFADAAKQFGGTPDRKRRNSTGNPISCILGLRHKSTEEKQ